MAIHTFVPNTVLTAEQLNGNFSDVSSSISGVSSLTTNHIANTSNPHNTTSAQTNFIQSGTGAVTRTAQDKMRETISVKDFGAVGNGVSNDGPAIVAARDSRAGGLNIFLPTGSYSLSSNIGDAGKATFFNLEAGTTVSGGRFTAPTFWESRQRTATAGSVMGIRHLFEEGIYDATTEAGIWSASVYSHVAVSREFNATNSPGAGDGITTGGPLSAIFSFANNNGSGGDVVSVLGVSVARTNSGSAFGANFIARTDSGVNGAKLVGVEIDIQPLSGQTISTSSAGLLINPFNITIPVAIQIGPGLGTAPRFSNGILATNVTGTLLGVSAGGSVNPDSIINSFLSSGNFGTDAVILANTHGVRFQGSTGGSFTRAYSSGNNLLIETSGSGDLFLRPASNVFSGRDINFDEAKTTSFLLRPNVANRAFAFAKAGGANLDDFTVFSEISRFSGPVQLPSYTVATLPSVATFIRCIIYVSDGSGNKKFAVSDGTNWRWPDGSIVS